MDVSVRRRSTTQQSWSVARVAGAYPLFVRSTSSNTTTPARLRHRTCRMRQYLSRPPHAGRAAASASGRCACITVAMMATCPAVWRRLHAVPMTL